MAAVVSGLLEVKVGRRAEDGLLPRDLSWLVKDVSLATKRGGGASMMTMATKRTKEKRKSLIGLEIASLTDALVYFLEMKMLKPRSVTPASSLLSSLNAGGNFLTTACHHS